MREVKFQYGFESVNGIIKKTYHLHDIPNIDKKCDVFNILPLKFVRQYIVLKDKNGKEIFEGDIAIIDGIKCIIKWNKGCNTDLKYNGFYGFYGKDLGKIQGIDDHLTEVIGNIHENPELL